MKEIFIFEETGKLAHYQKSWGWKREEIFPFSETKIYFEAVVYKSEVVEAYKYVLSPYRKHWEIIVIQPTSNLPQHIKAILLIKGIKS